MLRRAAVRFTYVGGAARDGNGPMGGRAPRATPRAEAVSPRSARRLDPGAWRTEVTAAGSVSRRAVDPQPRRAVGNRRPRDTAGAAGFLSCRGARGAGDRPRPLLLGMHRASPHPARGAPVARLADARARQPNSRARGPASASR